ncbi:hypothetical protein FHW96_004439 [Novosphingobium sp. SG751A]|uniref:hypothetical protein n=1 Tax=Novosphingobium sp. SG751A TaxID=2587000 RepID=UPI0015539C54|nr:hypothetical protein [Novosphingobium sp. SG751A]NOW48251.1 hypothetical protein [Novosphingobium sp. SG751A]
MRHQAGHPFEKIRASPAIIQKSFQGSAIATPMRPAFIMSALPQAKASHKILIQTFFFMGDPSCSA